MVRFIKWKRVEIKLNAFLFIINDPINNPRQNDVKINRNANGESIANRIRPLHFIWCNRTTFQDNFNYTKRKFEIINLEVVCSHFSLYSSMIGKSINSRIRTRYRCVFDGNDDIRWELKRFVFECEHDIWMEGNVVIYLRYQKHCTHTGIGSHGKSGKRDNESLTEESKSCRNIVFGFIVYDQTGCWMQAGCAIYKLNSTLIEVVVVSIFRIDKYKCLKHICCTLWLNDKSTHTHIHSVHTSKQSAAKRTLEHTNTLR